MIDFELYRNVCKLSDLTRYIPDEVSDGLIDEIYIEYLGGEIVADDMIRTMMRRYHDWCVNYIRGKKVTCKHTGEVFKERKTVRLDEGFDVCDIEYDDEEFKDLMDSDVEDVAVVVASFSRGESKSFNVKVREMRDVCPDDKREFLDRLDELVRDIRRKNKKH